MTFIQIFKPSVDFNILQTLTVRITRRLKISLSHDNTYFSSCVEIPRRKVLTNSAWVNVWIYYWTYADVNVMQRIPWSIVLVILMTVKKFIVSYRTWKFITVFINRHWVLSWARLVHILISYYHKTLLSIVAYLLKARTLEPEKQPLLAKGSETTFVFTQRPRKRQLNDVRC
jgi:hypothetical protein